MRTIQIHNDRWFKSVKTIPIGKIVYIGNWPIYPAIYVSVGWRLKCFVLDSIKDRKAIEILKREFSFTE